MSWWTDLRDETERNLGIATGEDAANTLGSAYAQLSTPAPAPAAPAPAAPRPAIIQSLSKPSGIAGLSIAAVAALAVGAFLILRRS